MGRGPSIAARKGAEDAKRGAVFTKLIREITVAARTGGVEPAGNPRLRIAIDKALDVNMTKDTIDRALKRASGADAAATQEIRYEGYGPGGVAVIVDTMTDNPTRTIAEVRHAFSKGGGNVGTSGSVAFQFAETGELIFELAGAITEDRLMDIALEAGADDVASADGYCDVLTQPAQFEAVKKALVAAGLVPLQAEVTMRPANRVAVTGEQAQQLQKMLDLLEDLDDTQTVYHNADLS
jgi:YebC/PmpR family DNA-binding regulatory protein